jgi:hypothetical protein
MKKIFAIFFSVAIAFCMACPIQAAKFESGDSVFVKGDEVAENLYAAGGNVMVESNVSGDLFSAGGTLNLNGDVKDDLFAGGGNITVNGKVGGDLRIGGGNINLNSEVSGETMIGGGMVILGSGASLNGKTYIGAGYLSINGTLGKDAEIGGGTIVISGTVNGNLDIEAEEEVIIEETAVINGNLIYKAPKEATIKTGSKITGEVKYEKLSRPQAAMVKEKEAGKAFMAAFGGMIAFKFIFCVVLALILILAFKNLTISFVNDATEKANDFWKNLLYGFMIFILAPAALLTVAMTIIGLPVVIIAGLSYCVLMMLAHPLAAIILGSLIFRLFGKYKTFAKFKKPHATWVSSLVGLAVMFLLCLIPFLGWIINCALFLTALCVLSSRAYKGLLSLR